MKEHEEAKTKMSSVSRRMMVERPRLDEQLVLSLRYRTTLIHAPHGYGKSTAVGQFLTTHQFSHAYMQCTTEDNHAKTFASGLNRMLISLLQHVVESDEPADVQISHVVSLLEKGNETCYLVFDDVEFLHHKHITAWFAFLAEYLPDSVHLLLLGTDVSVYPKASMYRDAVLRITRETLAITQEEGRLMAERFTSDIDDAVLTLLLERTWGSPLLVNAFFAQGAILDCEQVKSRLQTLGEYFTPIWEEVPRKAEAALFYTALLGTFVLGKDHETVEAGVRLLMEKSLFVEIAAGSLVVIHPLFRSYVLDRLKEGKIMRTGIAVSQAISYLLAAKLYREVIMMTLEIEDYALTTDLLDEYCATLLSDGYLDFIMGVIDQLPQQSIERYASLLLLEIISGIRKGWTAQHVSDRIARVKSSRMRKKMQEVDLLPILDGIDLLFQRDFYRAEKLLNKLPDELSYLRPLLSIFLASLTFGPEENLEKVYHHLQETLRTIGVKQNDTLSIVLLGQIGSIQMDLMLFEEARQSFDEALRLGYDEKSGYDISCSHAWICKGMLYFYLGKKEEAEKHLLQGYALGKGSSFYFAFHAQLALAEFYIVTDRHEEAVRLLRDAGKQANEYDVTAMDDRVIEAMHAMSLRRVGDIPALEMWVHKYQRKNEQQGVPFDLYELEQRQVLGYYQLTGQTEQAETLYVSLQTLLKDKHRLLHSVILSLEYGAFDLQTAELSRTQVNESHISTLRELYASQHVPKSYLLTDRELEVLKLIEKGFLNKEIAQMIHITERTVKWHASKVYEKLQVASRMEAVSEARRMGIL